MKKLLHCQKAVFTTLFIIFDLVAAVAEVSTVSIISPFNKVAEITNTIEIKNLQLSATNDLSITTSETTSVAKTSSVGGTVIGGTPTCAGSSSGLFTLSGHTGIVVRWESSVSPFTTWTPIAHTGTSYDAGALYETTQFRAVVQDGVSPEAFSNFTIAAVESTTWDGTAWSNGLPTNRRAIIFSGNITLTSNSAGTDFSFSACSVKVTNGAVITVPTGMTVSVSGALIVDPGSTFIMPNQSNLVQGGTTNINSGDIIVERNSRALYRLDYTVWSSPLGSSQKLLDFSPLTRWSDNGDPLKINRFYSYYNNLWNPIDPSLNYFSPGAGFLIRMPNNSISYGVDGDGDPIPGQVFTGVFVGTPNNGTITVPVTSGAFVSLGNPYPSTLNATLFLEGNSSTGTLYYWRKRNSDPNPFTGYATYTADGGPVAGAGGVAPADNIQVGQGFIMKPKTTSTITFTNQMRTDVSNSRFLRTKALEKNRIWLNLTKGTDFVNQILVGYIEGATSGVDDRIDGEYINDSATALTSDIEGGEYVIQGRALPFDSSDVVALNFKTETEGTFTITKDNADGFFADGQDVFLVDAVTGVETNLQTDAYTFTAAAGTANTRFTLRYLKILGVAEESIIDSGVTVYKNNGTLTVSSKTNLISSIKVYDIQGRLIVEQKNVNTNQATVKNLNTSHQVLLVQVTTEDNKVITKKVIN